MKSEQEKIEELLKPRWKVVADYPECPVKVGTILLKSGFKEAFLETGYVLEEFANKYPHLFKKLEWWEERKSEEMPKYVKSIETKRVYMVYDTKPQGFQTSFKGFLPATEQDYLQNKQKI